MQDLLYYTTFVHIADYFLSNVMRFEAGRPEKIIYYLKLSIIYKQVFSTSGQKSLEHLLVGKGFDSAIGCPW